MPPASSPPKSDGHDAARTCGAREPDAALRDWLVRRALPFWSTHGVDRRGGGFFETFDLAGTPLEAPRRARVVARQVYVFAVAARRGWLSAADANVEHGLAFLFERMRLPDGTYAAAVRPDGAIVDPRFDLYEHAFILFALAAAAAGRADREPLHGIAEALLGRLRAGWSHPHAGFEESVPPSLPLRSNPHMHLLEAALAWTEVTTGAERERWHALAAELVGLCLERFVDRGTGALHECFDAAWRPLSEASGESIEPGHQFEWSWLLGRWSAATGDAAAGAAAARLLAIGESSGVDPRRGVAVNALGRGFAVVDPAAKLWPQTERIKAWQLAAAQATDPVDAAHARAARDAAIAGLERYWLAEPAGLWHEVMAADGSFVRQPCRASSLYHIVCAIDALQPPVAPAVAASFAPPPR